MLLCPNNHENLDGLSHCRVCGLPLHDLGAEFASLAEGLSLRCEMGRRAAGKLLVGLGTVGAGLIETCQAQYGDSNPECSYVAVDTAETSPLNGSGPILRLKIGSSDPGAGTFCGVGEEVTRDDPHLLPVFRRAGLNHQDENQVAFFIAGVGGGIGSAASVLIEKARRLNPDFHAVALIVVPGLDESFHNQLNACYALSRLLDNGGRQAADTVIALQYDRIKRLRGVGAGGQELAGDGLLSALTDLLLKNLSSQYITEIVRINRSAAVNLVVPCLALGRSLEIFASLNNILESAVSCSANRLSPPAVLTCHLLLRVPLNRSSDFGEEAVNEHLWSLVRNHFPGVKAVSQAITYSDEQHDRIDACILLGGGSAASALFADDSHLADFQEELERQSSRQPCGLNQETLKLVSDTLAQYDLALDGLREERKTKKIRTRSARRHG